MNITFELLPVSAIISDDKMFRYTLTRIWNSSKPIALLIMCNPSKADGFKNDNTMTRVISIMRGLNYGGVMVGNVFAYRETDQYSVFADYVNGKEVIGDMNDFYIKAMYNKANIVIFATGNLPEYGRIRYQEVLSFFPEAWAFKITKKGFGQHPLYLKSQQSLIKLKG